MEGKVWQILWQQQCVLGPVRIVVNQGTENPARAKATYGVQRPYLCANQAVWPKGSTAFKNDATAGE